MHGSTYLPAMHLGMAVDYQVTDQLTAFYAERAKGGAGMICAGYATVDELSDGSILIERRKVLDDWTRVQNNWILIKNGVTQTFPFQVNLYSGQELRDHLEDVGFVDVKLYGTWEGRPYNVDAQRLIAVGKKP